jgi:methylenetetrahydrofolate dehydrogenase (NADP+)/methenyltetrahydrofolate cyclohydrolase
MTAQLIDGKSIAASLRQQIAKRVAERRELGLRTPGLAVILVGSDPASQVYVSHKRKDCEEVGFLSQAYDLPSDTTQQTLADLIDRLNDDPAIDGVLLQLPLPEHLDASKLLNAFVRIKTSMVSILITSAVWPNASRCCVHARRKAS